MPSKANIYGHPIHPMLVAFPIVFFIMAVVADVVYEAGLAGSDWSQFAYILLIGGIATAIAAAITGLIEYSIIDYVLLLSIFVASKCLGIILYVFGACFPEFHVAAKVTHIHLSLLFFQTQPKRG